MSLWFYAVPLLLGLATFYRLWTIVQSYRADAKNCGATATSAVGESPEDLERHRQLAALTTRVDELADRVVALRETLTTIMRENPKPAAAKPENSRAEVPSGV